MNACTLSLILVLALCQSTSAQNEADIMNKGIKFLNKEQYEKAETYFTTQIKTYEKNTYFYYYRGYARSQINKFDECLEDLQISIDIQPNAEAYSLYAQILLNLGSEKEQMEKALSYFKEVAKLEPQWENINSLQAETIFRLGDKAACCMALERAIVAKETMAQELFPKYCGNAQQGGESLMLYWPPEENWKMASNTEDEQSMTLELLRDNETFENWTELAHMQSVKGAVGVEMDVAMKVTFQQAEEACENAKLTFVEKDEEAEHPWIIFKIECDSYKNTKDAESQVWYIIQGSTSLYMNFRAVKEAKVPEATAKKWIDFFKTGKVAYVDK